MKARSLVVFVALLVGLSACGEGTPEPTQAASVEAVQDAVDALRDAGTARVSGIAVHTFLDSGVERQVRTAFTGTYEADGGPRGDAVQLNVKDPDNTADDATAFDTWDLGDLMVWPNFGFNGDPEDPPPPPWVATYRTSEYRHASPLTAFSLIGEATEAQREGRETLDGVELTRWKVITPAVVVNELFGYRDYSGVAIDCQAGFPMTVWIDLQGRLRRIRLVTEMYDGDTFDGEFTFADLGQPDGADVTLPPEDQITGSLDPAERKRERDPRGGANPCSPTEAKPTGVDRGDCSPSSLEGFEQIDRLGRFTPGQRGTLHYSFKEPTPAPVAFEVATGLPIVDFHTKYIGPGGWELTKSAEPGVPPGFDPTDQAAVRALLSRPSTGEYPPADIGLLGITLEGTWAELAAEASNCRYRRAER